MRKAVTWVDQERRESGAPLPMLLQKASMKFNLGPKDCEFLTKFFAEKDGEA